MKLTSTAARYLQLTMLCLSIAFIISTWLQLKHDSSLSFSTSALQTDTGDAGIAKTIKPFDLPPISDFTSIIERPLFEADRRPESIDGGGQNEIVTPQSAPGNGDAGNMILSAIVLADDKAIALVQTKTDHKIHRLETGETIGGWTIKKIKNKEIILSKGNETRNLELLVMKSPAAGSIPQRQRRTSAGYISGS